MCQLWMVEQYSLCTNFPSKIGQLPFFLSELDHYKIKIAPLLCKDNHCFIEKIKLCVYTHLYKILTRIMIHNVYYIKV